MHAEGKSFMNTFIRTPLHWKSCGKYYIELDINLSVVYYLIKVEER